MPTPKLQIKTKGNALSFTISGLTAKTITADNLRSKIVSGIACVQANRCNSKDQTVAEKLNCVNTKAMSRFQTVSLQSSVIEPKVTVGFSDKGAEIVVEGAKSFALKNADLQKMISRQLGCVSNNKCLDTKQSLPNKLNCINTSLKARFN